MRMADCHPERLHNAFGLCAQCYMAQYDRKRKKKKDPSEYAPNYRKPPPNRRAPRIPECGHPDRPHAARGMCHACYQKSKAGWTASSCHPDRPVLANGLCAKCYRKGRYDKDPETAQRQARETGARTRKRLREQLIEAYGGKCSCPKCPETNPAFLTLEHVNGTGKEHRAQVGRHAYADLRRRGFPKEGYTLLCWNCNCLTRGGKTCPHMEA